MGAEARHGIGHGRRQTGIVFDRAFLKGAALRGIEIERGTEVHSAPGHLIGDQRKGKAGGVATCGGGGSPRRAPRVRPDIVDPTRVAGPSRNADWPLIYLNLSPGRLEALQVLDAVSGL